MKYQEYQRALKLARNNGYEISVPLNSKFSTLQGEYLRHFNGLTVTFDYANNQVIIEEETSVETPIDNTPKTNYNGEITSKGATKMPKINGVILFEGKSAIDNTTDIVVIATGLTSKTTNPKTGDAIQTWILLKDIHPTEAINDGTDSAICGNCPHRKYNGKRSCYVNPMSFSSVYRAYKKGNYPQYNPAIHSKYFQDRIIRYGSYGDTVNIPTSILHHLSEYVSGHTGYTHQWKNKKFDEYKQYMMASVDSLMELLDAKDAGWSTFRVKPISETTNTDSEVSCQGGVKTNCAKCLLCDGADTRQTHVSINAHGSGSKYVK